MDVCWCCSLLLVEKGRTDDGEERKRKLGRKRKGKERKRKAKGYLSISWPEMNHYTESEHDQPLPPMDALPRCRLSTNSKHSHGRVGWNPARHITQNMALEEGKQAGCNDNNNGKQGEKGLCGKKRVKRKRESKRRGRRKGISHP